MSIIKTYSAIFFVSLIAAIAAILLLTILFDRPPKLSLVSVRNDGTSTVSLVLENASDRTIWIDSSQEILRVYQVTTSDGDIVAWRSTDVPGFDRIDPDEKIRVKFVADKPPALLVLVYESQNRFGFHFQNKVPFSTPDKSNGAGLNGT